VTDNKNRLKVYLVALIGVACFSIAWANNFGITQKLINSVKKNYGEEASVRIKDWGTLIDSNHHVTDQEKLKIVNDFFNQMKFTSDQKHWGQADYWATPVEFLSTGAGDCEDFSIAKYFTLKELGVADNKLRITYVKAMKINQAHMVLTYYEKPYAEPLVLDNIDAEIKPGSKRMDLKPVYSFNGNGLWLAKERGRGKRVSGSDQINLWADVEQRMSRDFGN